MDDQLMGFEDLDQTGRCRRRQLRPERALPEEPSHRKDLQPLPGCCSGSYEALLRRADSQLPLPITVEADLSESQ